MQVAQVTRNGRLVLTPQGSLMCSGPAEHFEELLQTVLAEGHLHLVVALEHVPHIDSGGIRALVRAYLTAQRLGGTFVLAGIDRRVFRILAMMRLDRVFTIFETTDAALAAGAPQEGAP